MKLTYLWIQRFGKLKEKEIFLEDGINVIYGPNESGKSTLHSFIRGMLFGMTRYRGRASRTDPYTRFEPWERPADYAGSMKFESGGKEFRIDRNFYKNDIRESLICETDGEQLSISHGDLEMLLGGINESIYDNTISIGQLRSETDEGMVRELQKYMANYEGAGSGDVDVQRAMERLKKKKKEWEIRKQECERRQNRQIEQMEDRIGYVRQEKEALEHQFSNVQAERKRTESEKKKQETVGGDRIKDNRGKNRTGNTRGTNQILLMSMLVGAFLILSGLLAAKTEIPILPICLQIAGVLPVLFAFVAVIRGKHQSVDKEDADRSFTQKQDNDNIEKEIAHMKGREEELKQQIAEKETILQNLLENREEVQGSSEELQNCDMEIKSLELAMETLIGISGNIRRKIGRKLRNRMESILSEITNGKYSQIIIDEDMKITLYERNHPISLYQLSRGTVEQVYFALRMAVGEVLCGEKMPVLLDDVFAMYDEERLQETLKWLSHRGGQALIFTCHKREAQMLSNMGIKMNYIKLNK